MFNIVKKKKKNNLIKKYAFLVMNTLMQVSPKKVC